jgi:hypothetical protein
MLNQLFALGNLGPGVVIGLIFLTLVLGALFLMLSFRIFLKFTPSFGKALTIMLVSFAAVVLLDLLIGWLLRNVPFVGSPLLWLVNLAVMCWIVQQMQRRPDGEKLSYLKAAGVTVGSFALELVVIVVLWLVVGAFTRPG